MCIVYNVYSYENTNNLLKIDIMSNERQSFNFSFLNIPSPCPILSKSFEQSRFNFFIRIKYFPIYSDTSNRFLLKGLKLISNCNLFESIEMCHLAGVCVCVLFSIDLSIARKQNSKFPNPNYKFNLFVHVNKADRIMVLRLLHFGFDWIFDFHMDISLFTICRPPIAMLCAAWDVILGNLSWP